MIAQSQELSKPFLRADASPKADNIKSTPLLHVIGRFRDKITEISDETSQTSNNIHPPFMAFVNMKLQLLGNPRTEGISKSTSTRREEKLEEKGKSEIQGSNSKINEIETIAMKEIKKEKREKKRLRKQDGGVVKKIESSKVRELWQNALQQDADEREVFNNLFPIDKSKKPAPRQFSRIFHQYVNKLEAQAATKHRKQKKPGAVSSGRPKVCPISQQLISNVTRHCLTSDNLWDVLGWIIRSHSLSSKQCPHLLSHLIKHEQLELLESCLINVHDLEEIELLRVLRYALNHLTPFYEKQWAVFAEVRRLRGQKRKRKHGKWKNTKKRKAYGDSDSDSDYSDINVDVDYENIFSELPENKDPKVQAAQNIMDVAISGGRNDPFLQQVLMTLNDDKLLTFLHYLHRWLHRFWVAGSSRKFQSSNSSISTSSSLSTSTSSTDVPSVRRQPSLAQVVDWASLLLDAHFPSLLAFPDRYQSTRFAWLLRHIRVLIDEKHILLCTQMETLRGFLDAWLKEKREEKSTKSKGRIPTPLIEEYSVEILTI